jgi:hypothetical protein
MPFGHDAVLARPADPARRSVFGVRCPPYWCLGVSLVFEGWRMVLHFSRAR